MHETLYRANRSRQKKLAEELKAMRSLTASRTPEFSEVTVRVTSYATINVRQNIYSVLPRLIGHLVKIRIYEERLELRFADQLVLEMPRLLGKSRHAINYRHVIWALVRKPGAFARYHYRDDLFISKPFKRAYDALQRDQPGISADTQYLRILHLAASTMQCAVELAINLLLDQGASISADAVKALVQPKPAANIDLLQPYHVDLGAYDTLIRGAVK